MSLDIASIVIEYRSEFREVLEIINSLKIFRNLRNLNISTNSLGDLGFKELAMLPCASRLVSLNLANNHITAQGMRNSIGAFTNLTSLDVTANFDFP